MRPKKFFGWGIRLVLEFQISDGKFSKIFSPASDGVGRCEAKGKPLHSISCSLPVTGMFYLSVYRAVLNNGECLVGSVNLDRKVIGPSQT